MAIEFAIEDRPVDGNVHVVAVSGEVDLFTAPEFKQRVMAPIAAGIDRVIVDLTETTFIDSSSLGALIGRTAGSRNGAASSWSPATTRRSSRPSASPGSTASSRS